MDERCPRLAVPTTLRMLPSTAVVRHTTPDLSLQPLCTDREVEHERQFTS